jgi:hypothetical protein
MATHDTADGGGTDSQREIAGSRYHRATALAAR